MSFKHRLIVSLMGLTILAGAQATTQPVQAASKGYIDYKTTFPKALRGTWQTKSKHEFVRYKIYTHSYTATFTKDGGKGTVTIHVPHKYLDNICKVTQGEARGQYVIAPKPHAHESLNFYAYIGMTYFKPVHHNGKKALADYPAIEGGPTYLYYMHK